MDSFCPKILFGQPYDEERYRQVIFACALEADLKIMPQGDQTEIGERGINMSGGQKQRIALARAAYSTAQLFLLDSPLSAVDSHTSTHIMKYCIQGLLKDKTILIVTHQFEVLEQCDLISIIRAGGKPAYFGPYSKEAMKQNFPTWTDTHSDTQHDAKEEEKKVKELNAEASSSSSSSGSMEGRKRRKKEKTELDAFPKDHELDDEEDRALDTSDIMNPNVKNTNPWILWARVNGWFWSIVSISLFVIAQCVRIASDYWITMWTKGTVKVNGKPLEGRLYMMYYSFFVAAFLVFLFFRGIVYYTVVGRGASRLHNRMFRRIIRAPIGFFTVTPTGPLLNCFSSDQDCVDESLPDVTHMTLIYTCILLTTLVLVCIVLPYYTIVAVVLLFCFILVQWFSSKGLNQLKVMASNASEPIFQHVSETVSGISVVRAYELQKEFSIENMKRLDRNHSAIFHMEQGNLWVSFWLDLIGSLLVLATAAFAVGLQLDSSLVGLAITSSVQILVFFSMIVKGFSSMRTDIHAVGRVNYYTNVARTEDEGKNVDLDVDFPPEGKVSYKKLTMSYFQNSPIVLDNVSFTIKAGEKVGVVGRTGSGKSTLLMALFRLVEAKSGKIVVDGVNTHDAGLSELRSSLAIIPQEPVCFAGTVRSNLDPFNEHTDEELWKALKLAHLHKFIKSLPGDLYSAMAENGNNFSLGQRQLMCLARAILKDSSILVLDEATSAMDLETDSLIQHTIRKVFAKSTTITIAHRLDTIIDSDKILVMGNGKVQEFDTPRNLLSNPNSQFSGYVKDAGLNVASILAHPHPEADGEEVPGA
jgi:ABC-type multidrug transport system fused ATPase/permease subunit